MPFRDHHRTFRGWVAHCQPEPEAAAVAAALADEAFCRQMVGLGEQNAPVSQEIWEQAYLGTSSWTRLFVQHPLLDQPQPEQS
jgi:hypothetical protein